MYVHVYVCACVLCACVLCACVLCACVLCACVLCACVLCACVLCACVLCACVLCACVLCACVLCACVLCACVLCACVLCACVLCACVLCARVCVFVHCMCSSLANIYLYHGGVKGQGGRIQYNVIWMHREPRPQTQHIGHDAAVWHSHGLRFPGGPRGVEDISQGAGGNRGERPHRVTHVRGLEGVWPCLCTYETTWRRNVL